MFKRRFSFLIVALCAACGSDFQATGSGGSGGDSGRGNAPGSSGTGTGADAGDTSSGGTGEAGEAGATSGGSDPGAGGTGAAAGTGGLLPVAGSGGTAAAAGLGAGGGSAGGGGNDTCLKLRAEYLALVDDARACSASDQCSPKYTLPPAAPCGCPYLINGKANTEKAKAKYEELEKNGCLKGIACPQALCAVYKDATCEQGNGPKGTLVCTGDSGLVID